MAKVALIKLFTGLNLAPAQLSGELLRAGHDPRIIYFKDHKIVPFEEKDKYAVTDFPGILIAGDGSKKVWNCYNPFNDKENRLLIDYLRDFAPDVIGFSVLAGTIREASYVTNLLKQHFNVPFIWGGPGPTLEPDRCIQLTDIICINEGEEVIVDIANRVDAKQDLTTIAGTWAKDSSGKVIQNPKRPLLKLDDIAIPDWNLQHYVHINAFKGLRPISIPTIWDKNIPS